MTAQEGQRWTAQDTALFRQPACQLLGDQSEAILDHPAADEQAQTNIEWEELSVHFKLWSFGLVCLLPKLRDTAMLIPAAKWLSQWKERTIPDGLKGTLFV